MPNQARRVTKGGQINKFYRRAILHMGNHPAKPTPLHHPDALHMHAKRTFPEILYAKNVHVGKSHEALINSGRVGDHGGSSLFCWALNTNRMTEPPPFISDESNSAHHSN